MGEYEVKTVNGKKRPVHVLLMEQALGRKLTADEVVHHLNENKKDNRLENLTVMTRAEHTILHRKGARYTPESVQKMREAHRGKPGAGRKLDEESVKAIVRGLTEGKSLRSLAKEHGVSPKTVALIRDGKLYRDVLETTDGLTFPLAEKKPFSARAQDRSFSIGEVSAIRIRLMTGESAQSVAKDVGVSPGVIRRIRDGETYADIPWPEEIGRWYGSRDMVSLVNLMLTMPMDPEKEELQALREDYHLIPDRHSVLAYRMVRRALDGDAALAMLLLSMSVYDDDLDKIFLENSVLLRTLYPPNDPT